MRTTNIYHRYVSKLILLLALCSASPFTWPASAAPAAPGAISIAADGITYLAQDGDTLISIARRLTTKPANWVAIGKVNRIDKDSDIPIGTGIFIPAELLADEPSEAKVVALSGVITATGANGADMALALGAILAEGVQIQTGNNGFVTLALPDASRISLPSNSRVRLAKLRMARYTKSPRTEIMLLRGRVESRVSPLESSKGRFEVRTPHSVAGVRGTHFRVGITDKGVTNEVLSGKVAVGNAVRPNALTLAGGTGNLIDARTIGPAIDLLPAPELADKTTHEFARARFSVSAVAGAGAYRVQLATDPDAQNILAESRATGREVTLDAIADGHYFIRISAIDKSGLEGFTSTQPVTIKKRAEALPKTLPGPPFVDVSDDKEFTLRWTAQPGKTFTLQVARDADFTWLLYNTTSTIAQARLPRPPFGTYYARVQAIEADGSKGPFSMAQPFVVTDQWIINDGSPIKVKEQGAGPAH